MVDSLSCRRNEGADLSKWPGKYVIGLTGNIGTGKSVVRRMLEHLGAYGIDADALSHRAIAKGAPGYQPVIKAFGQYVLGPDGQIDRTKLGRLVFSDAEALKRLEDIIHPLVLEAIDLIISRSTQNVIVIEAVKLQENYLAGAIDSLWVVYAPEEIQLSRLVHVRGLQEKDARQRIASQPLAELQLGAANVIIKNVSTYEDTWRQVVKAWQKFVKTAETGQESTSQPVHLAVGDVSVQRASPKQTDEIIEVINRLVNPQPPVTKSSVMAAFGEKAYILLKVEDRSMGILAWQVENLVARTMEIALDGELPPAQYIPIMIREMERASKTLQCEVSLVVVPQTLARHDALWKSLGYEAKKPQDLSVLAWQEAAEECQSADSVLFFKQLRMDRVLRPI
jgi:dephospho-CoA kinase